MSGGRSDVPALWNRSDDPGVDYRHEILDIEVEIDPCRARADGGGVPAEEPVEWEVVVRYRDRKARHGDPRADWEEATDLAVEFMREFTDAYDGDRERALVSAIDPR